LGNLQKSLRPLERRRRKGARGCSNGKNAKEKVMSYYGQPELLPNGLLRVFDYYAKWSHLFKKVNGEWKHYAGSASTETKRLLENYVNA
tara:strand:- start:785 stop:1051 length:267 start_codon:yes stop_codon:yes gene_type:complete